MTIGLVEGTYEDARAMIGTRAAVEFAHHEVTWALIKYFCAMVRDNNASYWDPDFAQAQWGGIVSPRKSTELGDGHFVTTEALFRAGDGTPVARYRHVLFRYTPRERAGQ